MAIKRYWDYSEKERSEMSSETVESLLKYELMEAGVLAPLKPEFLPEKPAPNVDKRILYALKGGYTVGNVLFPTAEAALQAASLSCGYANPHYHGGKTFHTLKDGEITVDPVEICDGNVLQTAKAEIEACERNKKANEAARKAYEEANEKAAKVTSGVWDDLQAMRKQASDNKRVKDIWDDYLKTCDGDLITAKRFLHKALTPDQIDAAAQWFEIAELKLAEAADRSVDAA